MAQDPSLQGPKPQVPLRHKEVDKENVQHMVSQAVTSVTKAIRGCLTCSGHSKAIFNDGNRALAQQKQREVAPA